MDPGSQSAAEPRAGSSPRWGLGDVIWVYLAGLVLSLVTGGIGYALSGDTAGHEGALTVALSALGQFGGWFGAVAFVARTKGRSLRQDFGFTVRTSSWWGLFTGLGLFVVGTFMLLPIVDLIHNEHQQVADELSKATGAKLAVYVVLAALLAPVVEELLFRGLLLRALRRRMQPTAAIAVQALVFAFAHPLLSPSLGDLAVVPALFLLAAASGIASETTGDLSASILMHIGFNLVTTLSAL
jgi:membrane protease YdiL (CAAX protease family)